MLSPRWRLTRSLCAFEATNTFKLGVKAYLIQDSWFFWLKRSAFSTKKINLIIKISFANIIGNNVLVKAIRMSNFVSICSIYSNPHNYRVNSFFYLIFDD